MLLRRLSLALRTATARFSSSSAAAANVADPDASAAKSSSTADKVIAGQAVSFNEILQLARGKDALPRDSAAKLRRVIETGGLDWMVISSLEGSTPPPISSAKKSKPGRAASSALSSSATTTTTSSSSSTAFIPVQRADGSVHCSGRRKTSVASVVLQPGGGSITVNKLPLTSYFRRLDHRQHAIAPLEIMNSLTQYNITVTCAGGGITGQAGAVRHALARALQAYPSPSAPNPRSVLKTAGMLTRDDRMVERKKPGRAKARKSFQWVKR